MLQTTHRPGEEMAEWTLEVAGLPASLLKHGDNGQHLTCLLEDSLYKPRGLLPVRSVGVRQQPTALADSTFLQRKTAQSTGWTS